MANSLSNVADAFVTSDTAVPFPATSAGITVVWQVLGALNPDWEKSQSVPIVLACIVGIVFYLTTEKKGGDWRGSLSLMLVTLFNTATLAAAALGIASVTGGERGGTVSQ